MIAGSRSTTIERVFMHCLRVLVLGLPFSAGLVTGLAAQAITTAVIFGVVSGRDSAGVEDAIVTVTNTANGERWRTATQARGRYQVEHLSLGGPYTVEVRAIGFVPTVRTFILLSLGERRRADFTLTPMVVELAELSVTATVDPVLNAGRTGPAQTISDRLASNLPVRDRDFAQLTFLSPQAVLTADQGVTIAGQSDRLNNLQIDGTSNNDLGGISGTFGPGTVGGVSGARALSVEALQELQVLAAPFDVRYGMFAGGLVNAVTRSGSNRWEGTLSSYFQTEGLTGRDPEGRRADEFSNTEFAATVGGPIIRNRVAFFLDAGLQRLSNERPLSIGRDTTGGADSAGIGIRRSQAERFQTILRDVYGVDPGSITPSAPRHDGGNVFGKLTIWPGLNQRIELSQNYAKATPEWTGGPEGALFDLPVYSLTSAGYTGPGTVNATRLSWAAAGQTRYSNELTLARVAGTERCRPRSDWVQVNVGADPDPAVLRAGTNHYCGDVFANQTTWELTDNFSWLLGSHRLTLGTHDELIHLDGKNRSVEDVTGNWIFWDLDSLEVRHPFAFMRRVPGPGRPEGARSDLRVQQLGFYLQDQWSAGNLTLTGGLRFDVPFLPNAPPRNTALFDALGINTAATSSGNLLWSPRLGFNYDVRGRGTTFVRGGVGLFSGRPIYLFFSNVYESTGLEKLVLNCFPPDVPAFTSLDPAAQPTTCASGSPGFPEVSAFDPSFRFPRNLRLSLGADARLPWNTVGSVDLLYIRGVDQLDVIDANLAPPTATAPGEGGRVLYGVHDPSNGDASSTRRNDAFDRVALMRNSRGDRSISATVQLQKRLEAGEFNLAYTYTDARDRLSPIGFDFSSNLDFNPLDGTLDQRRLAASNFEAEHKVTLGGSVDLPQRFRLGVFYNGFSGNPFTYLVFGDANADGMAFNDALYVPKDSSDITLADPSTWNTLDGFIRSELCLQKQRGRIMRRNSCRAAWHTILNARLSKEFPTVGGQSIELSADLFNLLNLFDQDWGVQRRYPNNVPLHLVGYDDANGRGIYETLPMDRNVRDNEATRWRLQLGARYTF
jgi:hypothetical protein